MHIGSFDKLPNKDTVQRNVCIRDIGASCSKLHF